MGEVVRGRDLIAAVEGNFEELTLAVGKRRRFDDVLVVDWSADYGDGAIGPQRDHCRDRDWRGRGVTDYWGKPFETPEWRQGRTDRLDMPPEGRWPASDLLEHR